MRKFANFQKGEVIYDPDAGRGHLLHWFAGHFSHKSETGFPRYTAANEKANDFYQIAEYLIKGSLEDKSLQASFQWGDISGGRQHDLMLSDTSKAFTNYTSHSKLEHCYDRLGENARGLFFMNGDLEIEDRQTAKIRKEIIADGSLKLVVQILDKADCYLLYIERANPTKTINFLHLQTAEEVKNFFRDKSDPRRFARPVEDLSTVSGYQFWQASRDDILKTKEIDLTPAKWKPKQNAQLALQSEKQKIELQEFYSGNVRTDIEKDLYLLDEIESLVTDVKNQWCDFKSINDFFEVYHSSEFYGKRKKFTEAEKHRLKNIDSVGNGIYGTGFERILYSGKPKVLDFPDRADFIQPGLVIAINAIDKKSEPLPPDDEIYEADQLICLVNPVVTCPRWSADRSVIALVPKFEMTLNQLDYFRNYLDAKGPDCVYGVSEEFFGLTSSIGVAYFPVIEDESYLPFFNSIFEKLRRLYKRRADQPGYRYRLHALSIFHLMKNKSKQDLGL